MEKFSGDQLKKQAERVKSDSELIEEGAEYVNDNNADNPRLKVTEKSIEKIKEQAEKSIVYIQEKYKDNLVEKERILKLIQKIESAKPNWFQIEAVDENSIISRLPAEYRGMEDGAIKVFNSGQRTLLELSDVNDIEIDGSFIKFKVKKEVIDNIKEEIRAELELERKEYDAGKRKGDIDYPFQ